MAKVQVVNVVVLDNPSAFLNPFQFEITFECVEDLQEDLEWRIIYVGSAESEEFDQVLDTVYVGPVPEGRHMFVFQADPPDPSKIPVADVIGVTVVLLTCSYRGQEFIRVGYYVNNDYVDPELKENQPPTAPQFDKLQRNILATNPRVTRFKVDWDNHPNGKQTTAGQIDNSMDGTLKGGLLNSMNDSNCEVNERQLCCVMLKSKELESLFPPKPEEPREEDCCGTGCSPCVFDIYQAQLLEWEKACRSVMDSGSRAVQDASSTTMKPVLSQLQYAPFQLVYVKPHTEDTNIYRFQAVELGDIPEGGYVRKITRCLEFKIGQHLVMRNDCNESVLTRAYTPISDSLLVPGVFDVLIKLYSNGKMSNFIRNLKENAIVYWRGPYGNFSYSRNKFKHVFMFCAGTGVAPMYPIAKVIVEDEKDDTLIRFLFSCKKHTDILLREQICELAGYWNFSAHIFVSRDEGGESRYRETLVSGKISKEVVQRELAGKCVHHLLVLICGTKSFNKDMLKYVNQAGVPDENIHIF